MKEMEQLYKEMAELTMTECKKNCVALGSCCDKIYCQSAMDFAKAAGVTLHPTGNKLPMLSDSGTCIAPPHFRKLCSVHNCDINAVGSFPYSSTATEKYFQLRDRIEILEIENFQINQSI